MACSNEAAGERDELGEMDCGCGGREGRSTGESRLTPDRAVPFVAIVSTQVRRPRASVYLAERPTRLSGQMGHTGARRTAKNITTSL